LHMLHLLHLLHLLHVHTLHVRHALIVAEVHVHIRWDASRPLSHGRHCRCIILSQLCRYALLLSLLLLSAHYKFQSQYRKRCRVQDCVSRIFRPRNKSREQETPQNTRKRRFGVREHYILICACIICCGLICCICWPPPIIPPIL